MKRITTFSCLYIRALVFSCIVLLYYLQTVSAQPVTLDPTFSQNECEPISTFPWAEGFENNGTEIPLCWENQTNNPQWKWAVVPDSIGTPPTAYEGNFKARVCGYGSHYIFYYSTLVTPVFDLSNLSSPVVLSFRHVGSRGDYLMVGYKDYPDGTWIPLQSFGDTI